MFPKYLFTDLGFWFFTLLYTMGVGITVFLLLWPTQRGATRPPVQAARPKGLAIAFGLLLIYQFFHQAEHVTQMYQFEFLGLPSQEAHGIVWFLDEEWNHFIFNLGYTIGIGTVFGFLLRALARTQTPRTAANVGYMLVFLALEGWHLVEHTYRIIHHMQGLCSSCPGILDSWTSIDRLVLHFWFNYVALVLPAAVFVWYRFPVPVLQRFTSAVKSAVLRARRGGASELGRATG